MVARKAVVLIGGELDEMPTGDTLSGVAGGGVIAPVATRIRRSTNQSIPTGAGWTDLSWDVAAYQANGTFWTSGAETLIPETGFYQVFTEATFDGTGLLGSATANLQIIVNGSTVIGDDEKQVIINGKAAMFAMAQRSFTAGDAIKVQVKHSDANSVNVLSQGDHSPDIIITKLTGAKGDIGPSGDAPTQVTLTVSTVAYDYKEIVVANATVTATSKISAEIVPELDAENDIEGIADDHMRIWAVPEVGQIRFVLTARGAFVGPFKANYRVAA